ncbi:hypothetical protein ACY5GL_001874 [Cronobacter malonaticus]
MDVPVVEMIINADVAKEYLGVSAVLKNKWNNPIYIDRRFVPKSQHLISDWGDLSCSGKVVKYSGLRYNTGEDSYIKVEPGAQLIGSQINLAEDYKLPKKGICNFRVNFWISTKPIVHDDLKYLFFRSSTVIEFNVESMAFDKPFLKRHGK